jgi:hypothetical protein
MPYCSPKAWVEIQATYQGLPKVAESYVVHLTPLEGELLLPALVEEVDWPGVFEFRSGGAQAQ